MNRKYLPIYSIFNISVLMSTIFLEGSFTLSMTSEICLEMHRNLEIMFWKLEIRLKRNLIGFAVPKILCTIEISDTFVIIMKY